jgi:hypothetical protein
MRLRRTAIAAVLTAGIVVPAVSTAAVAFAQPGPAARPAVLAKATPKATKTAKPVKAVRFEASGTVSAVDVATSVVTLQTKVTVKSGRKAAKKTVITQVTVAASARIVVNGAEATLAEVGVGHRIVVTGTRTDSVYTATKVVTTGRKVTPAPGPTVTPSPAPSVTPSTEPTVEPTASDAPTSEAPTSEPSSVL